MIIPQFERIRAVANTDIRGYPCCACNQARQTHWSQRGRERRRRDSLATYLDTPTRTVNLARGEDDGHQHAPLLLRDGRTGAGDAGKHDSSATPPPPWIDRFKI